MSKRTQASLEFAPVGDLAAVVLLPESCPSWLFLGNRYSFSLGDDKRPENDSLEIVR